MLCALAVLSLGTAVRKPYMWQVVPFSKIAEEIMDADRMARELEWQVGNSTAQKESVQWFLSTSMKELTQLKKETLNASFPGSLGWKNQACVNRTTAKMPGYNQSLTLDQAMHQDKQLAPSMIDAHMYSLYTDKEEIKRLTKQLGECTAKCPASVSFLARARLRQSLARAPAPGPAPAPGAGAAATPPPPPTPRQLMTDVATAIYNTSASIDAMNHALEKDRASMNVMEKVTAVVMEKLLKAKKDMVELDEALNACIHEPSATKLDGHVAEALAGDTELTRELIKVAEEETKDEEAKVKELSDKLADCKKKCDFWHPN